MALVKSPLGNRFFSLPNKQLIEQGQYISNAKEFLGIQADELRQLYQDALQSALRDQWQGGKLYRIESVPSTANVSTVVFSEKMEKKVRAIGEKISSSELVVDYFGTRPKLDNYQIWFSHAGRIQKGPQHWHRDLDNILFLKVFIYLTDVRREDGPHYFLPGSHRYHRWLSFKRISESEMNSAFRNSADSYVVGEAGTVIVEDTFGLHRGSVPTGQRDRCIMQFQFSIFKNP